MSSIFLIEGAPGGGREASNGRDWHDVALARVVTGAAVAAGRAGDQTEIKALENRSPRRGEDACAYLNEELIKTAL